MAMPPSPILSPRDVEILLGYARGRTSADIARSLGVSEHSVKSRTHRMATRLGIAGARQPALVHYAYLTGHLKVVRLRPPRPLSRRSAQVLACAARGLGRRATAAELGISVETVCMHRKRLFKALGVHCTARAVAVAWEAGVLGPGHRVAARTPDAPRTVRAAA